MDAEYELVFPPGVRVMEIRHADALPGDEDDLDLDAAGDTDEVHGALPPGVVFKSDP